jgi:hypothetical protein
MGYGGEQTSKKKYDIHTFNLAQILAIHSTRPAPHETVEGAAAVAMLNPVE